MDDLVNLKKRLADMIVKDLGVALEDARNFGDRPSVHNSDIVLTLTSLPGSEEGAVTLYGLELRIGKSDSYIQQLGYVADVEAWALAHRSVRRTTLKVLLQVEVEDTLHVGVEPDDNFYENAIDFTGIKSEDEHVKVHSVFIDDVCELDSEEV